MTHREGSRQCIVGPPTASVSQTRTFSYNSLGRLMTTTNPESGVTSYTYFDGGSLKTRTDARNAMVTLSYDGRKRVKSKVYSGVATPNVTYCYDGLVYSGGVCASAARGAGDNPVDALTGYGSQVDGADAGQNFLTVDGLGRVLKSVQRLRTGTAAGQAVVSEYPFVYSYQVNDQVASVTYPSGRVVTYQTSPRDLVARAYPASGGDYVSSAQYTSGGAMKQMTLGSGGATQTQTQTWNSRGQMTQMEARGPGNALLLGLDLDYGTTNNNGNLWALTIRTGAQTFGQSYRYDMANRLRLAAEDAAGTGHLDVQGASCSQIAGSWCQRYGYDAFGNMWQVEKSADTIIGELKPKGASWYYHAGQASVDNRLDGQVYDVAGNLEQYSGFPSGAERATYDGDGRITEVKDAQGQAWIQNWYDGEGLRIKQKVGAATTWYVYDAGKQLMAEYGDASAGTAAGRNYRLTDHLGSTRALVDGTGAVVSRMDYAPFGGDLMRNGVAGYGTGPATRLKFTGKERDAETGLDYFGARYLSAAQGRYTSVDPFNPITEFAADSDDPDEQDQARQQFNDYLANPQNWNRYTYALNNPLKYIDKDGKIAILPILAAGYALYELGSAAYDAYTAYKTYRDPKATTAEKVIVTGGLLASVIGPGGGYGTAGRAAAEGLQAAGTKIVSSIGKDAGLVRMAEQAGKSVQRSLDNLVGQLAKGNLNPDIGTKNVFGNVFEARSRDGARVYFRQGKNGVEVLGKSDKNNQEQVIKRLKELYDK
jgi:RHS repeat-associated protein